MADLDIAAFLRAREVEREASAQADLEDPSSLSARRKRAEWTLADVKVKRQMLDWCEGKLAEFARSDVWGGWPKIEAKQAADDILDLLAQPYVDHPEFREEWK